jgi:hypothetical protein
MRGRGIVFLPPRHYYKMADAPFDLAALTAASLQSSEALYLSLLAFPSLASAELPLQLVTTRMLLQRLKQIPSGSIAPKRIGSYCADVKDAIADAHLSRCDNWATRGLPAITQNLKLWTSKLV